jgi:hypothetical protein
MDMNALFIPQGNDVTVTASFPGISDGTNMSSEFWYKPTRETPDTDPSVTTFTSTIVADPDNPGQTMATFLIPDENNISTGAYWWRVDVIDASGGRRTADCGTYMVEAV